MASALMRNLKMEPLLLLAILCICLGHEIEASSKSQDGILLDEAASDLLQSSNEVLDDKSRQEDRTLGTEENLGTKREPKFIRSLLNSFMGADSNGVGRRGTFAAYDDETNNATSDDVGSSMEGMSARINDFLTDLNSRGGYGSNNNNEQSSRNEEDGFPSFFNALKGLRRKSYSKSGLISANNEPQVMTKVSSVRNTHKPFGPLVQLNPQFSFTLGSHLTPGSYLPASPLAAVAPAAQQTSSSQGLQAKPAQVTVDNPTPAVSLIYPPVSTDEYQNGGYGSSPVNHQDSYQPPPSYQYGDHESSVVVPLYNRPPKARPTAAVHRPAHQAVQVHPHYQQSVPQIADHVQIGSYIGAPAGYSPFSSRAESSPSQDAQTVDCGLRYGLAPCKASQEITQHTFTKLRPHNPHAISRQPVTWHQHVRQPSVDDHELEAQKQQQQQYHAFTDVQFQRQTESNRQHMQFAEPLTHPYVTYSEAPLANVRVAAPVPLPQYRVAESPFRRVVSEEPLVHYQQYVTLLEQPSQQRRIRHQPEQLYASAEEALNAELVQQQQQQQQESADSVQFHHQNGGNLGPVIFRRVPVQQAAATGSKVAGLSSAPKNQPASTSEQIQQPTLKLVQTRAPAAAATKASSVASLATVGHSTSSTSNQRPVALLEAPVDAAADAPSVPSPSSSIGSVEYVEYLPASGDSALMEYVLVPQSAILGGGKSTAFARQRVVDGRGRTAGFVRIAKSLSDNNNTEGGEEVDQPVENGEDSSPVESQ